MSINAIGSIEKYLFSAIQQAINNGCAKTVERILKEVVQKKVYDSYSPEEYERTRNLIDSITIKPVEINGKNISVEIVFDEGKMNHTSLAGSGSLGIGAGDKVYIPKWVDEGDTWNRPTADFMGEAKEKSKEECMKVLVQYLSSLGIRAIVK